MNPKSYVLDTNVLIHDYNSFTKILNGNKIYIPFVILWELDKQKKRTDQVGVNARHVTKLIEQEIIDKNENVIMVTNSELPNSVDLSHAEGEDVADDKLLNTCLMLKERDENPILITKDVNLRVKARVLEIETEDYLDDKVNVSNLYTGMREEYVSHDVIQSVYENGYVDKSVVGVDEEFYPNEAVVLVNNSDPKVRAITSQKGGRLILMDNKLAPFGLECANLEQQIAANFLLDPEISLVTLTGAAGSGKSLIAIASALEAVLEQSMYRKLTVARPIMPFQKDIGYLKGDLKTKLIPWFGPIMDNLEFLFCFSDDQPKSKKVAKRTPFEELEEAGKIEMLPLTFIRGRSIPYQFILVDECFPYKQKVATEKGNIQIGSLFHSYIRGNELPKVRTFNESTNEFEYKNIISVSHKGIKPLIQIVSGAKRIKCTSNHPFLVANKGWVKAGELEIGDPLVMSGGKNHQNCHYLNGDQLQVVIGSRLGDGSIREVSQNTYRMTVNHGVKQEQYLRKKATIFNRQDKVRQIENNGYSKGTLYDFTTNSFVLPEKIKHPRGEHIDDWMLEIINEKGLAIFFMDDGSYSSDSNTVVFHINSFNDESSQKISDMLKDKFGIQNNLKSYHKKDRNKTYNYIYVTVEGTKRLLSIVSPYLDESCAYKNNLPIGDYEWNNKFANYAVTTVTAVNELEESQHVFDMEVEDNHNFVATVNGGTTTDMNTGYVVHNCQNLTKQEILTVLTRAGANSKIVMSGDYNQIDNPFLSADNNGLVYAVEKFKDQSIAAHISLSKCERSELAEISSKIL